MLMLDTNIAGFFGKYSITRSPFGCFIRLILTTVVKLFNCRATCATITSPASTQLFLLLSLFQLQNSAFYYLLQLVSCYTKRFLDVLERPFDYGALGGFADNKTVGFFHLPQFGQQLVGFL
jgi:hypothetical protein